MKNARMDGGRETSAGDRGRDFSRQASQENRGSPRTEAMVAAAVQWAEKIMRQIDNLFEEPKKTN
jgi:hypothetical protein